MMKANKKVMAALLAAMMTVSAGAAVVSAADIVSGPGSNEIVTNTGRWYRYSTDNGYVYRYLNTDNTWATGWKLLNGKWYYFQGETGYALSTNFGTTNGLVQGKYLGYDKKSGYDNAWFRFDENCAMVTGWYQRKDSASDPTQSVGNGWEYYNANGVRQDGWIKDGANWFYIAKSDDDWNCTDSKGNPVPDNTLLMNGTYTIYGVKYTFAANGVLVNEGQGWVKDGNNWYYVENGNRVHASSVNKGDGWRLINGKYYYFDTNGVMATGWQCVETSATDSTYAWFYFTANGNLIMNNWVQTNGNWYLVNPSGKLMTGWVVRGGKTYYLNEDTAKGKLGVMWTGTMVSSAGDTYTFGSDGALISVNNQPVNSDNTPGV